MEKFPSPPKAEVAPKATPSSEKNALEEIDFILEQHEPLRERWENLVQDLPLDKQLERLRHLAQERRRLLAPKPYISEHLRLLEEMPEKEEAFFSETVQVLDATSREVGRGFNGKIVEHASKDGKDSNLVFKILIRSPIGEQNDLLSEASYLSDLHAFSERNRDLGVGVPKPFYCATASNARIIAMQKVPGLSIESIVLEEVSLPENLDIDALARDLSEFVLRMNATGLYHNDLRIGNIMIDLSATEAGQPKAYIVDAGNMKQVYRKTEEEHKFDKSPDRAMLYQALQTFRGYQARQRERA